MKFVEDFKINHCFQCKKEQNTRTKQKLIGNTLELQCVCSFCHATTRIFATIEIDKIVTKNILNIEKQVFPENERIH